MRLFVCLFDDRVFCCYTVDLLLGCVVVSLGCCAAFVN